MRRLSTSSLNEPGAPAEDTRADSGLTRQATNLEILSMRHWLALSLIFIAAVSAVPVTAAPLKVAFRNLAAVSPNEVERRPGVELHELRAAHPDCDVFVVTGISRLNSNVTERYKWFYDAKGRNLVMMCRTSMTGLPDDFRWRIWTNTSPSDFSSGLPYGQATPPSKASPYGQVARVVPLDYPENKELIDWP